MYLSDTEVKTLIQEKKITIIPYMENFQGPNCYYCHLGRNFFESRDISQPYDPLIKHNDKEYFKKINTLKPYILMPGSFVLAETFEMFGTDEDHIIRLFNSSSLARSGVGHLATGMINPGCGKGQPVRLTLELHNAAPFPVTLTPTIINRDKTVDFGTEVLKVSVLEMTGHTDKSYNSWSNAAFNRDKEVTQSKMHLRKLNGTEVSISKKFNYE